MSASGTLLFVTSSRYSSSIQSSSIGYCLPARTMSVDINISPRAIAQTASNTLRCTMLHSSWTLLGMRHRCVDCCHCKRGPAHSFGIVMIRNTVTACHQYPTTPRCPWLTPLVGVRGVTNSEAVDPIDETSRQYSRIAVSSPAYLAPLERWFNGVIRDGANVRVHAALPAAIDRQRCLSHINIAGPNSQAILTMRAVATYRKVTTILNVINGVTVLTQDPDLSHVASLAIGRLNSEDSHDGLMVDGRETTPEDVAFVFHSGSAVDVIECSRSADQSSDAPSNLH